ncbi:MAG: polyprenyl synthetase family protein [Thermoflavifilum sp.]|nr:polyprenyl synthetase family protein [Thermoflavifilum sp.]MCL6514021.1 polyprenyl synthetase family protein [Alicyclobacillus sp.]
MSIDAAREYLQTQGKAVDAYLAQMFASHTRPARLFEAMNYSLLGGGKRLRPVLCLAAARALGRDEVEVLPVAAAIELVHCYSLIHDDLPAMDNDDLRRGKPTNHRVFGEALAILAGDALLTYAFEQLSRPLAIPADRQLRAIHVLAHAAGCYGMVAGQAEDILQTGGTGDAATLEFIHLHKTAKLLAASVEMGAIVAGADARQVEALREYGIHLGLAFQIMDDLLDVIGTTEELGKSAGADQQLDKLTYPKLFGVEATEKLAHDAVLRAKQALQAGGIASDVLFGMADFVIRRRS